MKVFYAFFFVVLLVLVHAVNGFCEDPGEETHVAAIQSKVFHRYHEISLGFGYIPDDDFYYGYPISLGYTYHFDDLLAWEVVRGQYMINAEKKLKEDLENDFGVTPTVFREQEYAIHSHFVVKPLYGKDVFRDRTVINHETYFFAGGGTVIYDKKFSVGPSESEYVPSLSLGVGQKIFLNQNFCLNIEIRDWVNFREDKTINNFWFGLSLGYRFNLSARENEKDETIERLKKYLQ